MAEALRQHSYRFNRSHIAVADVVAPLSTTKGKIEATQAMYDFSQKIGRLSMGATVLLIGFGWVAFSVAPVIAVTALNLGIGNAVQDGVVGPIVYRKFQKDKVALQERLAV